MTNATLTRVLSLPTGPAGSCRSWDSVSSNATKHLHTRRGFSAHVTAAASVAATITTSSPEDVLLKHIQGAGCLTAAAEVQPSGSPGKRPRSSEQSWKRRQVALAKNKLFTVFVDLREGEATRDKSDMKRLLFAL